MGQVLHGNARTTAAVRRAIQDSQESLRALAYRHGINPKPVAKWKKRSSVDDVRTGPKDPRSTVLSVEDEAVIVAFRRQTLLPLDGAVGCRQRAAPAFGQNLAMDQPCQNLPPWRDCPKVETLSARIEMVERLVTELFVNSLSQTTGAKNVG